MRPARVIGVIVLLLPPIAAHAQNDAVADAARALVSAAATEPPSSRPERVRQAAAVMARALAAWDRQLDDLRRAAEPALVTADAHSAFRLHVELGIALRNRGRFGEAIRELDAAAGLEPGASDLHLLRALTFEAAGRADDAATAFGIAWSLDPASPIKAYYALQRRGVVADDDRARAIATLETAYRRLNDGASRPLTAPFAVADVFPDTLSRLPVVGDAVTGAGFALLAAGHYSEGIAALLQSNVSTASNESPATHFQRAQLLEAEGRVSEARGEYLATLGGTLAGRSLVYVAIGRLARVEGDIAQAIAAYRDAVRLNPGDQTMRLELAGAYAAASDPEAAFTEIVGGLLLNPASGQLHAALGQLRLDMDRTEEAVAAFTRALELNPTQFEVRYALAAALTRAGRTAEASAQLQIFERARREQLERRRQGIQDEVEKEEALRRGVTSGAAR
jgi:tetratricopeptide (TPR) repeat protein